MNIKAVGKGKGEEEEGGKGGGEKRRREKKILNHRILFSVLFS